MEASRAITRRSASNLALAFVLLPKAKRDAMSALYACCREVDDVADDTARPVGQRRAGLADWRADLAKACAGQNPHHRVSRELQPVIARYRLPFELFDELIRGVEMDLDTSRYATLADLETYCYRVASVVGLLSIQIFGYRNPACRTYADHLGKALQLTNILRDVRTDADRGRIYLPLEVLRRFEVPEDDILRHRYSPRFAQCAGHVSQHARHHYRLARQSLPREDRRTMAAAELMGAIYWRLLLRLHRARFNVFGPHRIRVSRPRKLFAILRAACQAATGLWTPNYGTP